LHGLSFAVYLVASIRLVYELSGKAQAATAQSVLASVMAVGNIVGAFANGFLLDRFGIAAIFWSASAAVVAALALFAVGYGRFSRHSSAALYSRPCAQTAFNPRSAYRCC
jgi:predicted MFS family arabinose efflux permease